jgi:hypothetical protein
MHAPTRPGLPLAAPLLLAVAALAGAPSPAAAQPPGKAPAPAPSTPPARAAAPSDDAAPLRGPAVSIPDSRPTLVQRDLSGRVVRLDTQPAEAAVRLLPLDDATRAKVDAILLERSAILDRIVTGNLELLARLESARDGADPAERARLTRELAEKSAPLVQRGPLAAELIRALPAEQGAELRRLVQEYWKAIADEAAARPASEPAMAPDHDAADEPPAPAAGGRGEADRRRAMRDEVLRMTGAEVRRAFQRTIGAQARDFDALIRDLNLSPEQESKVRQVVGDSFQRTYGKATPQERAQVFWRVYRLLDAQQQRDLLARVGARRAADGHE